MTLGNQNTTFHSGHYFLESVTQFHIITKKPTNYFAAIMAEFSTITQPCSKDRPIKHDIMCHINTTGATVSARPQSLTPEQIKVA